MIILNKLFVINLPKKFINGQLSSNDKNIFEIF